MQLAFRLLIFCIIQLSCSQVPISPCPTLGTSAYVLVTITPALEISEFVELIRFYAKLQPTGTITYHFVFGTNPAAPFTTSDLDTQIEEWINSKTVEDFYQQSVVNSTDDIQYNDEIANVANYYIKKPIQAENTRADTLYHKKQIVMLCDYVNVNATIFLNHSPMPNTQILGLSNDLDLHNLTQFATFPVFSVTQEEDEIRSNFTKDANFEFPPNQIQPMPSENNIFIADHHYFQSAAHIFTNMANGQLCIPKIGTLSDKYATIEYSNNAVIHQILLPWLGNYTANFGRNCLQFYGNVSHLQANASAAEGIIENFVKTIATESLSNYSFTALVLGKKIDYAKYLNASILNSPAPFQIWADSSADEVFTDITINVMGALSNEFDHIILPFSESVNYNYNQSSACRNKISQIKMKASKPYHKPKHFYLALDDMIWMSGCAFACASIVGYLVYQKSKKMSAAESTFELRPLRIARNVKMARLPWEIKEDRIHIDKECLLGEGTHSDVYLGRLKGKAPIMQWIDKIEMRQFQDCAIAIRVPRHFDEAEEEQLFREVASMRRLKSHAHIALFLGWSSINDLSCSLLELTHTSLKKYLLQLNENQEQENNVPQKQLSQIQWQICDGMAYIHQRNLIHRDLAARNVLLTTSLRAKISGFGFCSDPGDPKFYRGSPLLRRLSSRWLAPEATIGEFSNKSDVWSYGILLWEIYTFGDTPFGNLGNDETVLVAVQNGMTPHRPTRAPEKIFNEMRLCWRMEFEKRPTFEELREETFDVYEVHENRGFVQDL